MDNKIRILLPLALVCSSSGLNGSALACCGIGPLGSKTQFVEQQNIIIWDSKAKEEIFIRKAQFLTNAKDFGFIAPTPTVPKIEEADSGAYKSLENLKPQPWGIRKCSAEEAGNDAAASAEIIQQVDVAGYRATTLRASNSESIRAWMKANKYASTPGIDKWLDFYVKKGW